MGIDFNEGSLVINIPKDKIDYDNNQSIFLYQYNDENGSLNIMKNKNNGIQIDYNYFEKGISCMKEDASSLDDDKEHKIAITWSYEKGKMILYIDEQKYEEDIEKF